MLKQYNVFAQTKLNVWIKQILDKSIFILRSGVTFFSLETSTAYTWNKKYNNTVFTPKQINRHQENAKNTTFEYLSEKNDTQFKND